MVRIAGFVCVALLALLLCAGAEAAGRCGDHPWCNTSLSPDARARLMLAAMSQQDKVGILTGESASDVDLPPIKFTDGAVGSGGAATGTIPATAMPAGIALAANFDQLMAQRYGAVVGAEVKHRGYDGDFGPTVNIMRTPLGGRTFEGYGEDPFLAAQTAVGWIDGFQAQGPFADVKHYVANNQEGQAGVAPIFGAYGGRPITNARLDPRVLHEIYMQAFEAALTKAHSATVMCSYNQVNGVYSCANKFLLTDVLRRLWGWNGFVVSDAAACHETPYNLEAGLNFDIAYSCYSPPNVYPYLLSGVVSQATLDARVFEILRTLFAYGFFDHPGWPNDPSQDDRRGDMAVADQAEEQGAVLLRNDGTLPIDTRRVHSIAVIGRVASTYLYGGGSSQVLPYTTTTALQGIQARAARAGIRVSYDDGSNPSSAAAVARGSDLAVVVAGDTSSEGDDKPCMSLVPQCAGGQATPAQPHNSQLAWGNQDSLISTVAAAQHRTVVVLETGAPVLTPWRDSVASLLEAWYPGEDGGTAIARVLFGDADPGGRLPATFPRQPGDIPTARGGGAQYPGTVTPTDQCQTATMAPCPFYQENYSEGVMVGYRWYDSQHLTPAYPFGFGLSYTRFGYSDLAVRRVRGKPDVRVTATVKNVGPRTGWAVPELYVGLPSLRGVPEPPWQLKGFAKLLLAPGQARRVTFQLDARAFSYWSDAANGWRIAPGCDRLGVGSSSRDLPLRGAAAQGGARCGSPRRRSHRRHRHRRPGRHATR